MAKTLKLWTSLGVMALSGSMTAGAVTAPADGQILLEAGKLVILADAAGEAGETGGTAPAGEAGETGGDTGEDRTDYLMDLSLIEGKMLAAAALAKLGELEAAKGHVEDSKSDAFADLKGHFDEMKIPGFAAELDAAAGAIANGSDAATIEAAMAKLHSEIGEARGPAMTAHEAVAAMALVLRDAAGDFAAAVKDGKITDFHEYADAWGYLQAAKLMLAALDNNEMEEHAKELKRVTDQLAKLDLALPDVTGKTVTAPDPSAVAGAVANIELVVSAIK